MAAERSFFMTIVCKCIPISPPFANEECRTHVNGICNHHMNQRYGIASERSANVHEEYSSPTHFKTLLASFSTFRFQTQPSSISRFSATVSSTRRSHPNSLIMRRTLMTVSVLISISSHIGRRPTLGDALYATIRLERIASAGGRSLGLITCRLHLLLLYAAHERRDPRRNGGKEDHHSEADECADVCIEYDGF